ncbi:MULTISPECIES: hypothetical protein [Cytobacillus]|nr:hypothetical protein [Cytobacillus firmus]
MGVKNKNQVNRKAVWSLFGLGFGAGVGATLGILAYNFQWLG